MKKIRWICFAFLALVAAAVITAVIFVKTFDAERFRTQLVADLSSRLGTRVDIDRLNLSLSLFRGLTLEAGGIRVQDLPDFSSGPLFAVKEILCVVDGMAFLSRREVVVSQVLVASPLLNLVKNKAGALNVSDLLARLNAPGPESPKSGQPSSSPGKTSKQTPPFPKLLVKTIQVSDGEFSFSDLGQTPPVRVAVQDFRLKMEGLSLSRAFPFQGGFSVFSDSPQVNFSGQMQLDPKTGQCRLDDVKVSADLAQISWEKITEGIPSLKAVPVSVEFRGSLQALVSQMIAGPAGLHVLSLKGDISGLGVRMPQAPVSVEDGRVSLEMSEKDLNFPEISLVLGGGAVKGKGKIEDYLQQQRFYFDMTAEKIHLAQPLPELGPETRFTGDLAGHWRAEGQGFQGDAFLAGLCGAGEMQVSGGTLSKFNLLDFVFGKISFVPDLSAIVKAAVPEGTREELSRSDTVFQTIQVVLDFKEEILSINRAEFVTTAFSLLSSGSMDVKARVKLDSDLFLAKDVAQSVLSRAPEFQGLVEEDGTMRIPLSGYEGPVSSLKIYPDLEAVGKRMIKARGKEEIKKLIGDVLGSGDAPADGSPAQPGQAEKPPEEKAIESILDSIFQ
ncbi:MAG: AsmA family protein [Candidatus Omnitrophota bacterium]|nr:AsmA family protein [Candidatus Omnitrophota bacterium]MDZ4241608.1 AsmA family protein [Candidatus Omnitrophota bacterium]